MGLDPQRGLRGFKNREVLPELGEGKSCGIFLHDGEQLIGVGAEIQERGDLRRPPRVHPGPAEHLEDTGTASTGGLVVQARSV